MIDMGTLNEIHQLKPRVSSNGAILKVKDEFKAVFEHNLELNISSSNDMVIEYSANGKVVKSGMYQTDTLVDFDRSGYYILIRSGSKWFDTRFDDWIIAAAPLLEDALFFRAYDTNARLERYEIKNGILDFRSTNEPVLEHAHFDTYVLENYQSEPQLIADYYIDEIADIKLKKEEMIREGENPDEWYDKEDLEEYLEKLEPHRNAISSREGKEILAWLEALIASDHWNDIEYD